MNRKAFLKAFAFTAASAGLFITACSNDSTPTQTGPVPPETTPSPEPATTQAPADCNDLSGLTKTELEVRQSLGYVPVSVEPDKFCGNCRFFKPEDQPNGCPGCQLFKGPINTKAYCKSWFKKDAQG
jgi:hypothetical protein